MNNPFMFDPYKNTGGSVMSAPTFVNPVKLNMGGNNPGVGQFGNASIYTPQFQGQNQLPPPRQLISSPYQNTFDNNPNPFINSPGMPGWINPDQQLNSDIYGGVYGNNNQMTLEQILMQGAGDQQWSGFQVGSAIPTANPYLGVRNNPSAMRPAAYQAPVQQQQNNAVNNNNGVAMLQTLVDDRLKQQMLMQLMNNLAPIKPTRF